MTWCTECRREFRPLGFARHRAMHRDAARSLNRYGMTPDVHNDMRAQARAARAGKVEREASVERYFHDQVILHGGKTRKLKGVKGDCDQLTIWPGNCGPCECPDCVARIHFVELKRPKEDAREDQARRHAELRALGCQVFVINTRAAVDAYVREHGVQIET